MLFNSLPFLILLFVTFVLYYLPPFKKLQIPILILASLVFYAYHQPLLVLLLLLSVGINIVSSYQVVYGDKRFRKFAAIAGVALNLSILIFFKYGALLYTSIFNTSKSIGEFLISMPLPIGISFFTFQGISLIVDVYTEKYIKGSSVVPKSLIRHAERILFFKGFFPQLISGPIVKAHDFLPQLGEKRFNEINWDTVLKKLIVGYFLKMVVADNLSSFTFWMTYPYFIGTTSLKLVIMLFGFSCQIFADFAGYSLIAIGLAKLFGYQFAENFNFPYVSSSFKEFWKRWNISLSSFLMEYLYIPLGGNKKGPFRTYVNLFIVMVLGGFWHGAAWSYAIWGAFHGLALVVERLFSSHTAHHSNKWVVFVKRCLVFVFVTFAWLLFKLPNFHDVIIYLQNIRTNLKLTIDPDIVYILLYASPVFFYHLLYLNSNSPMFSYFKRIEFLIYGLMIFLIVLNSGPVTPFIYFQF